MELNELKLAERNVDVAGLPPELDVGVTSAEERDVEIAESAAPLQAHDSAVLTHWETQVSRRQEEPSPMAPALDISSKLGVSQFVTSFSATFLSKDLAFDPTESLEPSPQRDWERLELIGRGAFGSVYRAFDKGFGTHVAVKEVNVMESEKAAVQEAMRETQLMRQLRHPNVVRLLDATLYGGQLHMFLEFMAGGSLAHVLRENGTLSPDLVRRYMTDTLKGLDFLHSKVVCHRDIKPANLLLSAKGVVKIGDFGTSRYFVGGGTTKDPTLSLAGSVPYMAPEIVQGKSHGRKVDIWSLGCTITHLISGKTPFSDVHCPNQMALMYYIARQGVSPKWDRHAIPPLLHHFLVHVFQRNPTKRPGAELLLVHPWIAQTERGEGTVSTRGDTTPQSHSGSLRSARSLEDT